MKVLPVGLLVMLTIAALIAGVALADVFTPRAPVAMSLAGAGACGLLFVIGRSCARAQASPWAAAGVILVGVLVFGFLLLLGMHLTGRPSGYGLQGFLTRILFALLVGATATLLPLVIIIVALRPLRGEAASPLPTLGLVGITAALSTATFVVSLLIFLTVLWVGPPPYRLVASLVTALLTPTFLLPVWTYLYLLILSRWRVPPSSLLLDATAAVRDRLGVEFSRIICLASGFGGNTCQIVIGFRSSTFPSLARPWRRRTGHR